MGFMSLIVTALNSVATFFHEVYLDVWDWVWPFWLTATWFQSLSDKFSYLAWRFSDFGTWVNAAEAKIQNILSWNTIWSYLVAQVPNLPALNAWWTNLWNNIKDVVNDWWAGTQITVQGWITAATAGLAALDAAWQQFRTVTLPALFTLSQAETWWNSRIKDVKSLIDSALKDYEPLWAGWQAVRDNVVSFLANPFDFLLGRFSDWFFGSE